MHIDSGTDRPSMAEDRPSHPIKAEGRPYILNGVIIIGWMMAATGIAWEGLIAVGVVG
jgi:hypothetical protein